MMSEAVEIRAALDSDLDRVAQVWHAAAAAADDAPPDMPSIAELRERVDVELADAWALTVACIDGEIVGMLAVKEDERVLDQLYISPLSAAALAGFCSIAPWRRCRLVSR